MKLEIPLELQDEIVVTNIKESIDSLKEDLEKRKEGIGWAVFDNDPKEDVKKIKKMLKAMKKVHNWFSFEQI